MTDRSRWASGNLHRSCTKILKYQNDDGLKHAAPGKETFGASPSTGHHDLVYGGPLKYALMAFGWLNVGLGVIGIVVPGLPTTPFLLLAAWAFSRSSRRFQVWLYSHRILGPPVRHWREHRAISRRAKVASLVMMASSVVVVWAMRPSGSLAPLILLAIVVPVGVYIATRPSGPRPGAAIEAKTP